MTDAMTDKPIILVVDDSRLMRVAARKILKNDFEVRSVSEGGKVFLYTRRVVTEIVLDEQP